MWRAVGDGFTGGAMAASALRFLWARAMAASALRASRRGVGTTGSARKLICGGAR